MKAVDVERLLLQTDSPVLEAKKGQRIKLANLLIALQDVAEILKRNVDEVQEIILENTLRLYSRIRN